MLGCTLLVAAGVAGGCGGGALTLDAPVIAAADARAPSPVNLDPISPGSGVVGDFEPPGPASVLTAAMNAELHGRALHGGNPAGYLARCVLDRFAIRSHASAIESLEDVVLYVDLSCEVSTTASGGPIWRGELRARTLSQDSSTLGSDPGTRPRLVARAFSDASRELVSDLVLRALGLAAEPSARVFADAEQERQRAGLDDSPFGAAALQETGGPADAVRRALTDGHPGIRSAAWNVVAMAAGPGDPWLGGAALTLDEDASVRFEQYKALARHGSDASLAQLRGAQPNEGDPLLAEFLADALKTGGTGLARTRR